ncbi:MAG TPA: helix-turn-helix transcriptional regulator [Alphaproteobacteria bacterium]
MNNVQTIANKKGRATDQDAILGQKLRFLRKKHDLTLQSLAQILGISAQQVQKYETGEDRLPAVRLIELCKRFNFSIQNFLGDYIQDDFAATGMAEANDPYTAPPASSLSKQEQKLLDLYRQIKNPDAQENVLQLFINLVNTQR